MTALYCRISFFCRKSELRLLAMLIGLIPVQLLALDLPWEKEPAAPPKQSTSAPADKSPAAETPVVPPVQPPLPRAEIPAQVREPAVPAVPLYKVVDNLAELKRRLAAGEKADSGFDEHGNSPLIHASAEWYLAAVRLLLEYKADVNLAGDTGSTALHYAQSSHKDKAWDNMGVVRTLLEKGADIGIADKQGGTPLHWAALFGNREAVALLIEKGAEVGAVNKNGMTALHFAATERDDPELVRLLISKGADVNAVNKFDETPLTRSEGKGNEKVSAVLRAKGAK